MERKIRRFEYLRLLLIIMLSVVMIVCLSTVPTYAKTKNEYKKIYKEYLKDNNYDGNYKFADFDNNGSLEVLYKDYDTNIIFTMTKSGKVKKAKEIEAGKGYAAPAMYSVKKNRICFFHADTGGSDYNLYKVKGTKVMLITRCKYTNGKFGDISYKINRKSVSREKYNKKVDKITKGMKELYSHG